MGGGGGGGGGGRSSGLGEAGLAVGAGEGDGPHPRRRRHRLPGPARRVGEVRGSGNAAEMLRFEASSGAESDAGRRAAGRGKRCGSAAVRGVVAGALRQGPPPTCSSPSVVRPNLPGAPPTLPLKNKYKGHKNKRAREKKNQAPTPPASGRSTRLAATTTATTTQAGRHARQAGRQAGGHVGATRTHARARARARVHTHTHTAGRPDLVARQRKAAPRPDAPAPPLPSPERPAPIHYTIGVIYYTIIYIIPLYIYIYIYIYIHIILHL